ncbi:hypothetical protein ACHAWF_015432, partial [Thalassiosira exigua]
MSGPQTHLSSQFLLRYTQVTALKLSGMKGRDGSHVSRSAVVIGRGHGDRRRHGGRGRRSSLHVGTELPNRSSRAKLLAFGLTHVGFPEPRQKCREALCLRRFRAHYGVGPAAIKALVADLKHYQPGKHHDLTSVFMATSWLKLYDIEEAMAGRWGFGEEYCRKTVKDYVARIRKLKPIKISFDGLSPTCKFCPVDTMHIMSQEFRCNPDSKWWSHKFNGPGVSVEVVTDPIEGKMRWINGPKPASTNDLTFLRGGTKGKEKQWDKSSLYFHVPKNVKLVGDSAYLGQPDKVTTTRDAHKPATKKLFARMKSMQETCFKRLKDFKVL